MRYCPKCRSEYQDWVKVCIDCGTELTDKKPEAPLSQPQQAPTRPGRQLYYRSAKPNTEPIVTIATFNYPAEAHLSQAKLESEGIWSFVADDHLVGANQFYSIAVGGVRLQVRKSDAEKALRILELAPEEEPDSVEIQDERCPKCHSAEIQYETFSLRWVFLCILLLGFPLFFLKRKWKCKHCGYEWKSGEDHSSET